MAEFERALRVSCMENALKGCHVRCVVSNYFLEGGMNGLKTESERVGHPGFDRATIDVAIPVSPRFDNAVPRYAGTAIYSKDAHRKNSPLNNPRHFRLFDVEVCVDVLNVFVVVEHVHQPDHLLGGFALELDVVLRDHR